MTDENEEPSVEEIVERREKHLRQTQDLDPAELDARRQLHWMHCPKCGADLEEIVFRGVKIDKCFPCGGVFLDDGELEQLAGKPGWFEGLRYLLSRK